MCKYHPTVFGSDGQRRIFISVSGSSPHLDAWGDLVFVRMVFPQVALIVRPEIHHRCIGKQGSVDRMVRVVVTDEYMGHIVRMYVRVLQGIGQILPIADEAGVNFVLSSCFLWC